MPIIPISSDPSLDMPPSNVGSSSTASTVGSASPGARARPVIRLPTPKKTGNFLADSKRENDMEKLQEIMDRCLEDPDHIDALHSCLNKRVKAKREDNGFSSDCLFLQLHCMKAMEAAFVAVYLTTQTDLTMDDVLLTSNFDSDQPWQLMVMDTGLHSSVKLPCQCKVKSCGP